MSLLQQAALLNNQAITCLLACNYQAAVGKLSISLKVLKQQLACEAIDKNADALPRSSGAISVVELPTQEGRQNSCIFNQAFQIPDGKEEIGQGDVNVHVGAVIFNLALAYHRQENELKKASKLYQMTLKLVGHQCSHRMDGLLIQLASINNLHQLQSEYDVGSSVVGNSAMEAARNIRSLVSTVGAAGNDNHAIFFEDTSLQGLLVNVLLLKVPEVAPAA